MLRTEEGRCYRNQAYDNNKQDIRLSCTICTWDVCIVVDFNVNLIKYNICASSAPPSTPTAPTQPKPGSGAKIRNVIISNEG